MLYDMLEQKHTAYKTNDGLAILTPKAPLWIWLAQNLSEGDARLFFRSFLHQHVDILTLEPLVGLVADKKTAMVCADMYSKKTNVVFDSQDLIAYYLPNGKAWNGNLRNTATPCGELRPATPGEWLLIREWIQSFYLETLNAALPQTSVAFRKYATGGTSQPDNPSANARLFIWWDSQPTAMGMIIGEKGDTCRLNLIYTPPHLRGKGYGSALVSALAKQIHDSNRIPMLYTSGENIAANKLYQSLNFQEAGRLTEVRFSKDCEM